MFPHAVAIGSRRSFILAISIAPFGIVYGVAAAQAGVGALPGLFGSLGIFAGASQLTLVDLHTQDAAWIVAVSTSLVINARFVLYSAALAPAFGEFSAPWRFGLTHLMTDQNATLSLIEFQTEQDPAARRGFYFGAGITIFVLWQLGTILGLLAGARIPEELQLGFIIPLTFASLVVPALRDRPAIAAAITSVIVTIAAGRLPAGINILLGALAGICVGAFFTAPDASDAPDRRHEEPR